MGKKWNKFLNILTFGHLSRKAKKIAKQQAENKNTELKLNSMDLPNVELLVNALGGKPNISNISSTMSTITFTLLDVNKANIEQLKKICAKGAIKSNSNITLLIGDCANALEKAIKGE